MPGGLRTLVAQLWARGWAHWLTVVVLTVLGTLAGHWISQKQIWTDIRYSIYQQTFDLAHPRGPLYPKRTVLVLIQDEEYWKGELAGRAPVKRDYIARLIRKLDAAEAGVIAVDFDLRSPVSDGSMVEHPDYEPETQELRKAVKEISARRVVVLPATLGFDEDGYYEARPTILGGFDFAGGDVRWGYIQLPYDKRRIPVAVELKDGKLLDSFAAAVVAAVDTTAYERLAKLDADALPFGSYMPEAAFLAPGTLFSASEVMQAEPGALRRELAHKIVIVSGAWSSNGFRSGRRVDSHPTPAGLLPGALIHANYVEALLGERTYKPVGENLVIALEVALVLIVAVVLALPIPVWQRIVTVTAMTVLFVLLSYFFIQNLGLFFDFFVPVVVLVGHLAVEKVLHWRKEARYNLSHHAGAHG